MNPSLHTLNARLTTLKLAGKYLGHRFFFARTLTARCFTSCAAFSAFGLAIALTAQPIQAQNSLYYAGRAIGGEQVLIDLTSIVEAGIRSVNFTYVLDSDRIPSQANCNGTANTWTTLDDGITHRPESQATREMLTLVCGYLPSETGPSRPASSVAVLPVPAAAPPPVVSNAPVPTSPVSTTPPARRSILPPVSQSADSTPPITQQTALVYDPSSNVRATPNGQIICSIDTQMTITTYGRSGDWYYTDACNGQSGVIHRSQIQF